MQRTLLRLPRRLSPATRTFSTTSRYASSPFQSGPAPPRLPKEEQELFEKLQRQSTGAFSTPRVNQSPDNVSLPGGEAAPDSVGVVGETGTRMTEGDIVAESGAAGDEELVHPNMRRGAPPEFEGDVNPKTGEVGGPKNEPLRWGSEGDWSFNGRVTDF